MTRPVLIKIKGINQSEWSLSLTGPLLIQHAESAITSLRIQAAPTVQDTLQKLGQQALTRHAASVWCVKASLWSLTLVSSVVFCELMCKVLTLIAGLIQKTHMQPVNGIYALDESHFVFLLFSSSWCTVADAGCFLFSTQQEIAVVTSHENSRYGCTI